MPPLAALPDEEFLMSCLIIDPRGEIICVGSLYNRPPRGKIMTDRNYYVYIMSNNAGITYVGVTNDLFRRIEEHKAGKIHGFSSTNKTYKLVYYEEFQYIEDAIFREKQIKSWRRDKKRALIRASNPKWKDLSQGWYSNAK